MSQFLKDRDELLLDIFDIITAGVPSSVTVVQSEELIGENSPKPPKPYITYKIISGPITIGSTENLRRVEGDVFVLSSLRQYVVSLQAFGQEGMDSLALLIDNLFVNGARADGSLNAGGLLKSKGIAIVDRAGLNNITEILGTGFEKRYQVDIVFNVANNREVDITTIDKASISGTLKEEDNTEKTISEIIETP